MNDNEPHAGTPGIVGTLPAPTSPRRPFLRPALAQASLALAVLVIAWTTDALRSG